MLAVQSVPLEYLEREAMNEGNSGEWEESLLFALPY